MLALMPGCGMFTGNHRVSAGMQGRLNKLQGELGATSANAQRVLSFLGPKDKLSNQVSANMQHCSSSGLIHACCPYGAALLHY